MPDTQPAERTYRAWYQRMRSRALRRLEAAHKDEYRALLSEEQSAEPWKQ